VLMLYEHLIVPFDGSAAARAVLGATARLTDRLDAHLVVLTSGDLPGEDTLRELKARAIAMSEANVEVWIDAQRSPADAVAGAVAHRPRSLVCMATHARLGIARIIAGSVAERVLRCIDEPVLLFGPHWDGADPASLGEVVVCVDGPDVAGEVVTLAVAWARAFDVPCRLVHVGDDPAAFDRLAELAATAATEVRSPEVIVAPGDDPVVGIVDVLASHPGALAVLGIHPRRGLERLRAGSVAMSVVGRVPTPVLVAHAGVLLPEVEAPPADTAEGLSQRPS